MLLKFLYDLELQRDDEAKLAGKKFKPAIESPYRLRDWAAQSDGITGDELLPFIKTAAITRLVGKRGARRRARWCWCPGCARRWSG
jgi:type I restriction enzyme M protein